MKKTSFFNLRKFNLGVLQRFAMGAPYWKGREAFMWWNILDIVEGERNPAENIPSEEGQETPYQSWLKWVKVNSSLNTLKDKAIKQHKAFEKLYIERYAVTPLEARKFFSIVIGYHPEFGGYITSVGPYRFMDKKKKAKDEPFRKLDKLNRFAFFTLRAKSCTPKSLVNDAAYIRDNKIGRIKDLVELDPRKDFFIKTTFPDPNASKKEPTINKKGEEVIPQDKTIFLESLDSPDAELLFGPSPSSPEGNAFLQVGQKGVSFNAIGKYKILKAITQEYGLENNLNECIRLAAIKEGVTVEKLVEGLEKGANSNITRRGKKPDGGRKMVDLVSNMFDLLDYANLQAVAQKDGWSDILSHAISVVSGGMPEDDFLVQAGLKLESVEKMVNIELEQKTDKQKEEREALSRKLFKEIKKIKTAVIDANTLLKKDPPEIIAKKEERLAIANSIFVPNINILNKQRAGALIFTPVIQVKNHQKAQIDLRLKILKIASEMEAANPGQPVDLVAIAEKLKIESQKSKTQSVSSFTEWQPQNVSDWINQIKKELEIENQQVSYSDMYMQVVKKFGAIRSPTARNTYDSWKEAVENFKIFLMAVDSTQQDRATGAKILKPSAMETLNINVDNRENITWEQLCEKRTDIRLSKEELDKIKAEFDSISAEELKKIQENAASAGLSDEEREELEEEMAEDQSEEVVDPIAVKEETEEAIEENAEEVKKEDIKEELETEELKTEELETDISGQVDPIATPTNQPSYLPQPVKNELDFPVVDGNKPIDPQVIPPAKGLPPPTEEKDAIDNAKDVTNELESEPSTAENPIVPQWIKKKPVKDPVLSSLKQLIKISMDLKNEGNYNDYEEIQKIIKKYL